MKIKAGYRITVTSWENDGDNYNTISKDGLTEAEVLDVYPLLKLLTQSQWRHGDGFGNMYDPNEEEIKEFKEAILEIEPEWGEDACNYFFDIVGEYTGYGEFYTRMIESIEIAYTPVAIELEDVTYTFESML